MQVHELYAIYLRHPSVQTDTRKLKPNDLFFALKGPNFNANSFASEALNKGAAYVIIDDESYTIDERTIVVNDVLETLQALAKYHRQQLAIPFIAITGSNGKTTTKELLHAVLSTKFKTYTTEGNLNNHIGVPLTLLKIKGDAQMAVIEMGANHIGEIASYCTIVLPTHGLITNCGKAHLEGFGSEEGVRKGKGELFDFLRANKGTAFIYNDYDYLKSMSRGIPKVVSYGRKEGMVTGDEIPADTFLSFQLRGAISASVETRLVGSYNLPNVLAAATVGKFFEIEDDKIIAALTYYTPSNSRSQLLEKGTNKIILDAYNANPSSMKLAIENFAQLKADKKILVLGAMAELGTDSLAEHQIIIDEINKYKWNDVFLVGGDFMLLDHPYNKAHTAIDAGQLLNQIAPKEAHLLLKGSRSTGMEKVLDFL